MQSTTTGGVEAARVATSIRKPALAASMGLVLALVVWGASQFGSTNISTGNPKQAGPSSQPEAPKADPESLDAEATASLANGGDESLAHSATSARGNDLRDYMCAGSACVAGPMGDPLVAESIEEAAWMRERAFPTQQQRELARSLDADSLLRQAEADGSAALRILGLEKRIAESEDPAVIEVAATELKLRARQRRELYALYGEFEANRKLAALAVRNQRSATEALMAAMRAARLAVMLGDRKAASLYQQLPRELVTAGRWAMVDESVQLYLQRGIGQPDMLSMQLYAFRPSLDERPQPVVGQVPPVNSGG